MFEYADPASGTLLAETGAIERYRRILHAEFVRCATTRNSAFTKLEAFANVASAREDRVSWLAFPKLRAAVAPTTIDADRRLQDEYTEWVVTRTGDSITEIVFTTEFAEAYGALASRGLAAISAGVREIYPNATITAADVYGPGPDPNGQTDEERWTRFMRHKGHLTWNTSGKISFLAQENNNMFALFSLANDCAVPQPKIPSSSVCASSACVPERNSDPAVCRAVQEIARARRSLALKDPPGITIGGLRGIWEASGRQIDINAPANGFWTLTRGGHRGTLRVTGELTLAGGPVTSGAQVARVLEVGATVVSAPDKDLPAWARAGEESTRRIV